MVPVVVLVYRPTTIAQKQCRKQIHLALGIDEQLAPLIFELAEARTFDRALKQYHRPRFNPLTVPCAYCLNASVGRPG